MRIPDSLRSLRHRDFRLFASGQMVSLVGTWMQAMAQSWLVYQLTGSAVALGLVTFFGQLPMLVLSPVGGLVVDRVETQRLLVATQTLSMLLAALLGALTLAHWVQLWHVIACACLLGVANAFDNPGRQVFVAEAVPGPDLMNGIALNSSMVNGARVVGPAVAAFFVALVGVGWCFLLNAASYLAVIWALLRMERHPKVRHGSAASPLGELKEGFAFAWGCLPIRYLLALLALLSLLGTTYGVLMPLFADQVLHGGSGAFGLLSCAAGLGSLGGAVTLAMRKSHQGLDRVVAASSVLFGASMAAFALSRSLVLSALLLLPVGYGFMTQMAATNTLIQMLVPPRFRGRVMSIYAVAFLGMVPVGGLLVSGLSHLMGPQAIVALAGLLSLLGGAAFSLGLPAWRAGSARLEEERTAAEAAAP